MATIYGPNIVRDGLVLYLDANNTKSYTGTGTDWLDISGNSNTGVLQDSPTFNTSGIKYFEFDGTADYVTISDFFDNSFNTVHYTVSVWVYGEFAITTTGASDYRFYFNSNTNSNRLELKNSDNGSSSSDLTYDLPSGYNFNKWTLYTASTSNDSNKTRRIYIDGKLVTTNSTSYTAGTVISGLQLMKGGSSNNTFYQGYLANIRFYNRALSAEEIQQNYNALRNRFDI